MNDISRADAARIALLVRGLVAIGRSVPMPARAFYVAWLYRFPLVFGADLLTELASAIGVNDLPREAVLFVEWVNSGGIESDSSKRLLLEQELDAAGVWRSALAALDAGITALKLMTDSAGAIGGLDSFLGEGGDA